MPGGPWVCGNCRSINQEGTSRCYSCRAPVALAVDARAASTPRLVPRDASAQLQAKVAVEAGASYGSSTPRAVFVFVAIAVVCALTVVRVAQIGTELFNPAPLTSVDDLQAQAEAADLVTGPWIVAWLAGFVAWGAWLSRVIGNLPALGGGWPNATPRSTLLESFVPILNLYWTAGILREAIVRLSPTPRPGLGTWTAWWLCLALASLMVIRFGPFYILRQVILTVILVAVGIETGPQGILTAVIVIEIVAASLFLIAGILALRLVVTVERLQAVRIADLPGPRPRAGHPVR